MNTDRFLVRAKPIDEERFSHRLIYGNYYGCGQIALSGSGKLIDIDICTLQGCTGIRDVNGRLIFEGDYVKVADGDDDLGLVEWFDREGRYLVEFDDYGAKDWVPIDGYDWEVVEIDG